MSGSDADAAGVVVVLNCGSSSIKFAVFEAGADPPPRKPLWNGKVQGIGGPAPDFGETGVAPFPITLDAKHPYRDALSLIRGRITARLDGRRVGAKYLLPPCTTRCATTATRPAPASCSARRCRSS